MKIEQIKDILNEVIPEVLGTEAIKLENLENVVDIGKELSDPKNIENFLKKLHDRIGKTIFVDRPYEGRAPSVLMDGWEYGSILQKIRAEIPDAQTNDTWNLTDGTDYPITKFTMPKVSEKFFNQKDTYEVDVSLADKQVRSAFMNAGGVNALFSMIESRIRVRKTIDQDNLIMRTINTFSAASINNAKATQAINLLDLYNTETNASLTVANCMGNLDFLKFCAFKMKMYSHRMETASKLFNIGATVKFTPKSMQKVVLLDEFAERANIYLQSDTFHNEFTKFPNAELVSYWQGSGTDYAFDSVSKINVQVQNPTNPSENITVEQGGILGVIFDRDALGVCNIKDYVTSFYNPRAEFTNMWYKYDAQYFNDYDENFVVFYIAEVE